MEDPSCAWKAERFFRLLQWTEICHLQVPSRAEDNVWKDESRQKNSTRDGLFSFKTVKRRHFLNQDEKRPKTKTHIYLAALECVKNKNIFGEISPQN